MPVMNVSYRRGDLGEAAKADLAKRLTDVLIRMEGGANTQGGRAFAWVLFNELPHDTFWVGATADDGFVYPPGPFLIHVTIPEGYMNQNHKNEVHSWVNDAVLTATEASGKADAGRSILVVIDEVPEGNWGCAGHPISLASIAGTVGLSKTGPRFAWSQSYFAAKARMLSAFGYPQDMGGVPVSSSNPKE